METNDAASPLLESIGKLIREETKQNEYRVLLCAEVEEGALSVALFVERGNHIDYVGPSWDKNYDILFDLWYLQAANRWSEIEYLLERDTFKVRFAYAEEFDPEEESFDRRDRTVQRYFGEKPIVYPPWDDSLPTYDL